MLQCQRTDSSGGSGISESSGIGNGNSSGNSSGNSGNIANRTATTANDSWVEFLHRPGERFWDSDSIAQEILTETDRVCGPGRQISSTPLLLRLFGPTLPSLTLIDLPGMTRVALEGQPADTCERLREVIVEYIRPANCLILAVSAANSDLANSDALSLAKTVDPDLQRCVVEWLYLLM